MTGVNGNGNKASMNNSYIISRVLIIVMSGSFVLQGSLAGAASADVVLNEIPAWMGDARNAPQLARAGLEEKDTSANETSGLWAIRGVTRAYFGGGTDEPVPSDYEGDGGYDTAIFRGFSDLWAVKGATRAYYGTTGDLPVTR